MIRGLGAGAACLILIVAAVALPAAAQAAAAPDVRSLFPKRAEIFVDEPGLFRLLLPPEILGECQPGLSDLRVVDRSGREVPYLVGGGPPPDAAAEERIVFLPRLLSSSREIEERASAPGTRRETYHLALPAGESRAWDLVIESRRARFVRRFEVLAVDEARQGALVEEGSIFRLQEPLREKLRTTLPPLDAAYLAVTLEGEADFFLEPSFRFEAGRPPSEREQIRVDLAIRASRSHAGRTVVELERPRGLVPNRLAVATATGIFNRRFEVWDQGSGSADTPVGTGTLYRLAGAAEVARMELPLAPARGDALRVVIDDGDGPPLEELAFQAAVRRPSLVFTLDAAGAGEAAGGLLYGGARAARPRYDLTALAAADRTLAGAPVQLGAELAVPTLHGVARLGPSTANPLWDPTPALAFAMRPGTRIATGPFEYRRPLSIPHTREGLLRLALDAETVARSRPDLADVRLVDSESREWPYLLERAGSAERVPLAVRGPQIRTGSSTYSLDLPADSLRLEHLLLDGPAPFFDRPFELVGAPPGPDEEARTLARGRLTRRLEDPRALAVALRGERLAALELRIEDGDHRPLEWTSVEALIPLPELYFAAPQGDYALVFGDPEADPPRYELDRIRDLVLAVDSTSVEAGERVENPGRGPFSLFRGAGGRERIVLWAALLLAALVLAWVTLKRTRQHPASG